MNTCSLCGQRLQPKLELPLNLDTIEFRDAWQGWLESRRALKKLPTVRAQAMWLKRLEEWGADRAVAALNHSIMGSWVGIYEPKPEQSVANYTASGPKPPTVWELRQQLDAIESELREIEGRGTQHPLGWEAASETDRARRRVLAQERKRIRGMLVGGGA